MGSTLHGYWGAYKVVSMGELDAAETTTVTFKFGQPVDVKRLILVNTEVHTAANSKVTVGVRDADGSSNSVSHSAYTIVQSGSALGDVFVIELGVPDTAAVVAVDGLDTHAATPVVLEIDVDRQLFLVSDGGGDAGKYDVYAQVQEQGFHVFSDRTGAGTTTALTRVAV